VKNWSDGSALLRGHEEAGSCASRRHYTGLCRSDPRDNIYGAKQWWIELITRGQENCYRPAGIIKQAAGFIRR
jgi:hypothetical protein